MSESFDEWYKDQKEFQKEMAEQELGIVRCKDCKYYINEEVDGHISEHYCKLLAEDMGADDFCSRGERKDEID